MALFRAVSQAFTPSKPRPSAVPSEVASSASALGADEVALLSSFTTSWESISYILRSPTLRHEPLESTDLATNIETLLDCLVMESNLAGAGPSSSSGGGAAGDCLEMLLKTDIPSQLVSLTLPDQPQGCKGLIITFFLSLVVLMDEHFIVHAKVHKPLVRLLRSCVEPDDDLDLDDGKGGGWRTKDRAYEEGVVEIMCHVCSRIKTFPELLAVFLHDRPRAPSPSWSSLPTAPTFGTFSTFAPSPPRKSVHFSPDRTTSPLPTPTPQLHTPSALRRPSHTAPTDLSATPSVTSTISTTASSSRPSGTGGSGDADMLIFSYLLRFVHREGRTGDLARAGLLFLMEIAMGRKVIQAEAAGAATKRRVESQTQVEAALTLAEWVLDSDFSDVLGAGLGAAYGLLPSKLVVRRERDEGIRGGDGGVLDIFEGQDEDASRIEDDVDEDEELRAQRLGLGFSDSADFKSQFGLFIKLLEFTQDVLRRAPPIIAQVTTPSPAPVARPFSPSLPSDADSSSLRSSPSLLDTSAPARSAELIAGAITSAVLNSARRLFLSSIMYPSLLECSEGDGSAVAVMSYLEAMLGLLETDGRLADTVLRFLLTEDDDDDGDGLKHPPSAASQLKKRAKQKRSRRVSGALNLIRTEAARSGMPSSQAGEYFTSWGRFTLKDLLSTTVCSRDPPTASAALRLLQTILMRHDRYALVLLDVIADAEATAFPFSATAFPFSATAFPFSAPALEPGVEDEENFGVGEEELPSSFATIRPPTNRKDNDSEDEEFIYPGTAQDRDDRLATPRAKTFTSLAPESASLPKTPALQSPAAALAKQALASPAPTYDAHLDYIAGFVSLVEVINDDSSIDGGLADDTSTKGASATAWRRYLVDAETELAANASFQRGISALPGDVAFQQSPLPSRPSAPEDPFGWPSKPAVATKPNMDALLDAPLLRHRLNLNATLMTSILESLASFFSQPPDVNLALTGVVAALAACPTRSLEGWLVPRNELREEPAGPLERMLADIMQSGGQGAAEDGGDVDSQLDELARVRIGRRGRLTGRQSLDEDDQDAPIVLDIYRQLAEQVRRYRSELPDFERFLRERKQGLLFAENLADALDDGDVEASFAPTAISHADDAIQAEEAEDEVSPPTLPKPAVERAKGSFVSWFTPKKAASASPAHDPNPSMPGMSRRKPSSPSSQRPAGSGKTLRVPSRKGSESPEVGRHRLSPFAKHYEQTRKVSLTPEAAQTPASRRKEGARDARMRWGQDVETPTKKGFASSILGGDDGDTDASSALEAGSEGARRQEEPVSLSRLLGNVVLLEESIKELAAIVSARRSLGIDVVRMF